MRHVFPGSADPGDCDYWWDQEHDNRFFTFIDKYPAGRGPSALEQPRAGPRVRCILYAAPELATYIS